ncbi:MAG: VPLPA-CTERM sorting domain-containing protein [Roseovarius sp.]|jgi:hypothetical protein|uniref:VPLPA-CTERM sorting domain-containing protein n=1 Tax=Roseovarius sp. TaxID=1486281 RepID=UPI0032F0931C
MKNLFYTVLFGVLSAGLSSNGAEAATFAGSETLNATNDLTLINDTDNGIQLQFLDLAPTVNLSSSAAVSAFDGFGLATLGQVNDLFSAFGIDAFPSPTVGNLTSFTVTPGTADIAGLQAAIGQTSSSTGTSIGRFSFGSNVGELCINTVANCSLRTGWVFGTERAPSSGIGNFLVREVALAPIPLPASALLLIGALGGLAAMRRRRADA